MGREFGHIQEQSVSTRTHQRAYGIPQAGAGTDEDQSSTAQHRLLHQRIHRIGGSAEESHGFQEQIPFSGFVYGGRYSIYRRHRIHSGGIFQHL